MLKTQDRQDNRSEYNKNYHRYNDPKIKIIYFNVCLSLTSRLYSSKFFVIVENK